MRAAAEVFAGHELNGRQRALRAGARPRQHATIESHLTAIRDPAQFLTELEGRSVRPCTTGCAGASSAF